VGVTGLDCAGCDERRIQRGSAQPVDRTSRDGHWEAGQQRRHPGDVPVVFTGAVRCTQDNLIDATGVKVLVPVDECPQGCGSEVVGANAGKRATETPEGCSR
jgi:hypothetical protein